MRKRKCSLILLPFIALSITSCKNENKNDLSDKDYNVYAYYFPNWGSQDLNKPFDPFLDCEWGTVSRAISRFEGHGKPNVPLWGYENHSDPTVMDNVITAAKEYGVDGFIFDWYWYPEIRENGKVDGTYLEKELNYGFLNSSKFEDFEFALMWCNHDVDLSFGRCNGVFSDSNEFITMTDYILDNYMSKPNYIKINGKLYFGIYDLAAFVKSFKDQYGITDITLAKQALVDFNAKSVARGYGEITFGCFESRSNVDGRKAWSGGIPPADWNQYKYLGVENVLDFMVQMEQREDYIRYDLKPEGGIMDYSIWSKYQREAMEEKFKDMGSSDIVKYIPGLPVGYDPTVRISPYAEWDPTLSNYPNENILWNNTPSNVREHAKGIRTLMDKYNYDTLFVYSWNEWGESSYLEPDTVNGYSYLRILQDLFTKHSRS